MACIFAFLLFDVAGASTCAKAPQATESQADHTTKLKGHQYHAEPLVLI